MAKKTEGREWEKFTNDLMDAESELKGTDEEVEAQLRAIMTENGYDPDEVIAALKGESAAFLEGATVINLEDSKPVDQNEFIRTHGRPYYGPL